MYKVVLKTKGVCAVALITVLASAASHSQPFPPDVELFDIAAGVGLVIPNTGEFDGSRGISAIGDLNADGIEDFATGAAFADRPFRLNIGEVHVVFGTPELSDIAQLSPADLDGSNGFTLVGRSGGDTLGERIGRLGDFNNDGVDDLLTIAIGANENGAVSEAVVLFGRPGIGADGVLSVGSLDGRNGFVILNTLAGDFGIAEVSRESGDINGDGIADLAMVSPNSPAPDGLEGKGIAYVLFGGQGVGGDGFFDPRSLDGSNGGVLIGEPEGSLQVAAIIPDLNGDGIDELALGNPALDKVGTNSGRVYVLFGRPDLFGDDGIIELSEFVATRVGRGFIVDGTFDTGVLGDDVSSAGDFNGDGFNDLLIAEQDAAYTMPFAGAVNVIYGSPAVGESGEVFTSDLLQGNGGLVILPEDDVSGQLGLFVATTGDVDADGYADVTMSFLRAENDVGGTHVVFGGASLETESPLLTENLDGSNGFTLSSEFDAPDELRRCLFIGTGGDFNADGADDVLVGCEEAGLNGLDKSGAAFVVFGRNPAGAEDQDLDGVPDREDNCIEVANTDQRDTNGDGYGNVCDADLDNDCIVLAPDWFLMRDALGSDAEDPDLNGDGVVKIEDVRILFESLRGPPGPSGVTETCSPNATY